MLLNTMTIQASRQAIALSLQAFSTDSLTENALNLFETLGYNTDRQDHLNCPDYADFKEFFITDSSLFSEDRALASNWIYVDLLFQLSLSEMSRQVPLFDTRRVDQTAMEAYLFFVIELTQSRYTRSDLTRITRELNRLFPMPVMIVFKHGASLTLSIINRRLNKRDEQRDVLEKVTLIKDISLINPNRAHIEILFDLSIQELNRRQGFTNFVELHNAWQKTLDIRLLNERIYRDLFNWYLWASKIVRFPKPDTDTTDDKTHTATSIIRLLTRLIFIWFVKEKDLIPENLFDPNRLKTILKSFNPKDQDCAAYYHAILQNLFFATLNTPMNRDKPQARKFMTANRGPKASTEKYMDHGTYRYADCFVNPAEAVSLFESIPFLNGGLFECLDYPSADGGKEIRYDGFSTIPSKRAFVPNMLFFGQAENLDFSDDFGGDKKKRHEKATGIIEILNAYKFTIIENTPLEEEIALDPELLGKVFENLLASYTPETQTTARKQTGSFYTPREIVNYMVDESLKAYLETQLIHVHEKRLNDVLANPEPETDLFGDKKRMQPRIAFSIKVLDHKKKEAIHDQLKRLFDHSITNNPFNDKDTHHLIGLISECRILDPACGSGAFPMGILNRMVNLLSRLDPNNRKWKEAQLRKAENDLDLARQMADEEIRSKAIDSAEDRIVNIRDSFEKDHHEMDYLRKLFLILDCIFGVDIQQIAVQITKLRFFISLVADQRVDDTAPNRGIISLPNLETKLVAANSLIELKKEEGGLTSPAAVKIQGELKQIRNNIFFARRHTQKQKLRAAERLKREELKTALSNSIGDQVSAKLAGWNPFDQILSAEFFEPEWMFGLKQGFDIVIGNPPYVRHELIKPLKPTLKEQYKSCYTGTSDLYVYFFERSVNLLNPKGVLTFITSNKYFRSDYGRKLREFLGTRTRIRQLIDFGDAPVFAAISYPSIIIAQKRSIQTITGASDRFQKLHQGIKADVPDQDIQALNWHPDHPVSSFPDVFVSQCFSLPQQSLQADGWRIESSDGRTLIEKLRSAGKTLKEFCDGRIYYGIKTGLNEAFVVDRPTRDRLIAEHSSSEAVLKPLLRGRDIKRWRYDSQDIWLIFTRRGIDIECFPAIHNYLLLFKDKLMPGVPGGRKPGSYKWYEIQDNIAYWKEFEEPKIIYPNICVRNEFAWDETGYYTNQKAFIITGATKYLLGVLNSNVIMWLFTKLLARLQNDYYEPNAVLLKDFPIPNADDNKQIEIITLTDEILSLKKANAECSHHEACLDANVAHLYRLTAAEYDLILSDLKLSDTFRESCRAAFHIEK
jgi:hypothetical protein